MCMDLVYLNIQNENNITDFHNKNVFTFMSHSIFGMTPCIIIHNYRWGNLSLETDQG